MSKQFFMSGFRDQDREMGKDRWVTDELEARELDRQPGVEHAVMEDRPIINPLTGEQAINPLTGKPRTRRVRKDASLGFDSSEVVYKGDRVVKLHEEVEVKGGKPTGDIIYYFERISDDGRSRGTYKVRGEKVSEGRHRIDGTSARRYFT